MAKIDRLPNILPEDATKLRSIGITTTEQLWEQIGYDYENGLNDVATSSGVPRDRLVGLLADYALQEITFERSDHRRGDITLAIIGLCIVILLCTVCVARISTVVKSNDTKQVAVALHDLPPFTVIQTADITQTTITSAADNIITDIHDAVGQITLEPILESAPIHSSSVMRLPLEVQEWWVITVPVSNTFHLKAGRNVILIGVEGVRPSGQVISKQAVILSIEGSQIHIALPSDEARLASRYLLNGRRLLVITELNKE
jgi:hypothetical protein